MKKLIVIGIILIAGFSVSAQDGGRATVPDCYKCINKEIKPLLFIEWLVPEFRPVKPLVELIMKVDRVNETRSRVERMQTNPGDYIENYNMSTPVRPKVH